MQVIKGENNIAKVYIDNIEENCYNQIKDLLDLEAFKDTKIRIMPDCHAGASCVIGFTAIFGDKIIPNIVGVDIGCGMLTISLSEADIDFEKLDNIIKTKVPSGRNVHEGRIYKFDKLKELHCYRELKDTKRIERSLGTLGGGNHFIEIDQDDEGNKYLVIHTGSRNLGKQVAEYYQKVAIGLHSGKEKLWKEQQRIIEEYKAAGRRSELQEVIKELHRNFRNKKADMPNEFCYLYGEYAEQYLHDMKICQEYATINRNLIANIIISSYGFNELERFSTIHNYIDLESNIIRKGAVSAKLGEKLLIPINMRDGSLICIGKGNDDWNQSAPHGAGRLFSRATARKEFTVEEFEKTMRDAGIYSTSVNKDTLDESPMAYKNMEDIVDNIGPTVDIIKVIKPVYNFKASDIDYFTRKEKSNEDE